LIQVGTFQEMEDSIVWDIQSSAGDVDGHVRPVPKICRRMRAYGQIQPKPREEGSIEPVGTTMDSLRRFAGPAGFEYEPQGLSEAPADFFAQSGSLTKPDG
jgi:hypothetical protein